MILIGSPDEIRALVNHSTERKPVLIRAQESGVCVYYDPKSRDHCTYPYDRACPHLDDTAIICPVKDGCSAMRATALLREACEAEQEEQDRDMVPDRVPRSDYVLAPRDPQMSGGDAEESEPEFPAPTPDEEHTYTTTPSRGGWLLAENDILRRAESAAASVPLYREAFPESARTDGAIKARWYYLHKQTLAPAPVEDLDPDERDPDQMVSAATPTLLDTGDAPIYRGDRVALATAPEQVGTVAFVNARTGYASVEFPDGGPARVYALSDLRRVIA